MHTTQPIMDGNPPSHIPFPGATESSPVTQLGMKMEFGKKVLVVKNMSNMEIDSYFDRFGEDGWNDHENMILIDVKKLNEYVVKKYETFFGGAILSELDYIIIHLCKDDDNISGVVC